MAEVVVSAQPSLYPTDAAAAGHAPTFSVSSRGLDIHIPHPRYMWRGLRRSATRSVDMLRAMIYPVPVWAVVFATGGLCVYVYQAPPQSWVHTNPTFVWMRYLDNIVSPFNRLIRPDLRPSLVVAKTAAVVLAGATVVHRFLLRQLLRYTAYMTEESPGLRTRLWSTVMRLFFTRPQIRVTDIYEPCLPALPLPPLQGTVEKYLQSMRCIYSQQEDNSDWLELRRAAESFLLNEGPALQRSLRLHHVVSPNYVEEWWTRHVFLSSRRSLCVNSNFYTVPFADYTPTNNPAARAAVLTHNLYLLKRKIASRTLQPNFGGPWETAPLSMRQFFYAFNTVRVPGREMDTLEHDDAGGGDDHVILLHRGRIYQVPVQNPRTRAPLTPHQLEVLFSNILDEAPEEEAGSWGDSGDDEALAAAGSAAPSATATPERPPPRSTSPPPPTVSTHSHSHSQSQSQLLSPRSSKKRSYLAAEALLPVLTTAPRAEWADVRNQHLLNDPNNKFPLRAIERALFVVSFEDRAAGRAAPAREDHLEADCLHYLCGGGGGAALWCDKSFNLVVRADGRVGAHVEHSWCEIQTFATLLEYVTALEETDALYDDDGHAKWLPRDMRENVLKPPLEDLVTPKRLRFTIHKRLAAAIRAAHAAYRAELGPQQVELAVLRYGRYGRNLPAALGLDPDAWMQMALQLALYEDQGYVVRQVYESASQRAFARGRTEAVRSVTEESCALVRRLARRGPKNEPLDGNDNNSNNNSVVPPAEREQAMALLRRACERHARLLREARAGFGADRHLFALYMASVAQQRPSEFLSAFLRKTKWRASSYQAQQRRLPRRFHARRDARPFETPGAGFGPAQEDGYGISYCHCGEGVVYATVTARRTCTRTDARRLADKLEAALDTLAALADVDPALLPTEAAALEKSILDFSGELFGPGSPRVDRRNKKKKKRAAMFDAEEEPDRDVAVDAAE